MSDSLIDGQSKLFFDTNVLVYALDNADPGKRERCRAILRAAAQAGRGVVSTQVLQEFFVVLTRQLRIDPRDAKALVMAYENLEVVVVTPSLIATAIDTCILSRLSFWDALVVAAADSASCAQLVTEDLNDGQVIAGVRIRNPFT